MLTPDELDLSLFAYDDFRRFLRDYYERAREKDPKVSQRFLATRLGVASTGWISDLFQGRANLAGTHLVRLADLLKLKPREADYLEALVLFNQSGSIEERNRHYRKLASFKEIKADTVGQARFEYYSKWYYPAVRELLFLFEFKGDFADLGKRMEPPLKAAQAKEAITLLEKLEFIGKDAQGVWRPRESTLKKDTGFKSLYAANFHKAAMELGMESLDRFPKEERHVSSMILSYSAPGFQEALAEIETLRKKLVTLMQEDAHPEKAYQLNLQFFPVTRKETR